ncbi:MAG: septum formation protein Maf [Planctomycetes bacterium]|nr:septum formation protein Maf [Planctomycetota bacterium]
MLDEHTLILASASPRRRHLLARLGVRFAVQPCAQPEPAYKPDSVPPRAWARSLAGFKARTVAEQNPQRWVLGADTVVACRGQLLGKPSDITDARRMLRWQVGRASEVITGVCLMRTGDAAQRFTRHDVTRVWMRDDQATLEDYLRSGEWQGKAGAYGIQNVGDRLVERIEGSFSNVVGLPLERLMRLLAAVGIAYTNFTDDADGRLPQ